MLDFFLKGGPIMYPLLLCSIIALTVITVSIAGMGEIHLGEKRVSLDALAARIAAVRASNPSVRVLISGDREARHGVVVQALDILRTLSVEHVAIQTAPTEPEEQ
jgi:biopolymer transport protein ExbD